MNRLKSRMVIVPLLLTFLVSVSVLAIPVMAQGRLNPNKIFGNPSYVLNILGKKNDWNPGGSFDNFDRHTMFLPEDTTGLVNVLDPDGVPASGDETTLEDSVLIWMTRGDAFGVLDGNGMDGEASFQMGPGKYHVFVVALGKPGGDADLKGWYYDDEGEVSGTYLYLLGSVSISRGNGKPVDVDVSGFFWIDWADVYALLLAKGLDDAAIAALLETYGLEWGEDVWIFDFLELLDAEFGDEDFYFWELKNNGLKHIQVRIYEA